MTFSDWAEMSGRTELVRSAEAGFSSSSFIFFQGFFDVSGLSGCKGRKACCNHYLSYLTSAIPATYFRLIELTSLNFSS